MSHRLVKFRRNQACERIPCKLFLSSDDKVEESVVSAALKCIREFLEISCAGDHVCLPQSLGESSRGK